MLTNRRNLEFLCLKEALWIYYKIFTIFEYVKGHNIETIRQIFCHIIRKIGSLGRNHRKKILASKIIPSTLGNVFP